MPGVGYSVKLGNNFLLCVRRHCRSSLEYKPARTGLFLVIRLSQPQLTYYVAAPAIPHGVVSRLSLSSTFSRTTAVQVCCSCSHSLTLLLFRPLTVFSYRH